MTITNPPDARCKTAFRFRSVLPPNADGFAPSTNGTPDEESRRWVLVGPVFSRPGTRRA